MSQEHLSLVDPEKIVKGRLPLAEALSGVQEKCLALAAKEEEREAKEGPIKYYECALCSDLGMEIVIIDGVTKGARPCACRERKRILEKLAAIPTKHQHVEWNKLAPYAERFNKMGDKQLAARLIAMQQQHIDQIKREPGINYFLWGMTGYGKTACLIALYRRALMLRMPSYFLTLKDYLDSVKSIEFPYGQVQHVSERFDLEMLRQKERGFFVGVDEVSSPGTAPTAFAADRLRELVDAVISWGPPPRGHQLVVTSNYNADDLAAYWSRYNPAAGFAAVRRMLEGAEELEFN